MEFIEDEFAGILRGGESDFLGLFFHVNVGSFLVRFIRFIFLECRFVFVYELVIEVLGF